MCGRYAITLPPEAVRAFFSYVEQPNFPPRYNIAPTQPIPIVRRVSDSGDRTLRHFQLVRWGFVPSFVKDFNSFRPFVNARSEGLMEKASFRNAFRRRRCLVIADAFYEWQQRGKRLSQPYMVRRPDGLPFALAGVWENWVGADGSEMETACIITTEANATLSAIHPRMPVVIDPTDFDLWLDLDERSALDAAHLMRCVPDDVFAPIPIGPSVNKVVNDDAAVQKPISDAEPLVKTSRPSGSGLQGSLF